MKYCKKCNKSYPDNLVFCSECGERLSASPDVVPPDKPDEPANNQGVLKRIDSYFSNTDNCRNGVERFFKQHISLIVGILSIISFFYYWFYDLALGILGLALCKYEKIASLRYIAIACCTIGMLLGIVDIIFKML